MDVVLVLERQRQDNHQVVLVAHRHQVHPVAGADAHEVGAALEAVQVLDFLEPEVVGVGDQLIERFLVAPEPAVDPDGLDSALGPDVVEAAARLLVAQSDGRAVQRRGLGRARVRFEERNVDPRLQILRASEVVKYNRVVFVDEQLTGSNVAPLHGNPQVLGCLWFEQVNGFQLYFVQFYSVLELLDLSHKKFQFGLPVLLI